LEPSQLRDDVGRKHVGPHRQELPELHERRTELVEQLAEVASPLGGSVGYDLSVVTDEIGQPVPVEEVAEAVPDGDLGDLGDAPQATRRRLCHAVSVARGSAGDAAPSLPREKQARVRTQDAFIFVIWSRSEALAWRRFAAGRGVAVVAG
jgi:hypothetical protein